jgi:hypothetical protein
MTDDQETIWAELEALAQRRLEHPKDLEPREPIRRYSSLWRLWHFPAFGRQTTWTILTPGRKTPADAAPMVREVSWERTADHRRVFDPIEWAKSGFNRQPGLDIRDAFLPVDALQRLREEGSRLAVPIIVETKVVGVDGESFGLETYEFSPFVRVQWWCAGPAEWRHFTDWVGSLRAFVQHHLGPWDENACPEKR